MALALLAATLVTSCAGGDRLGTAWGDGSFDSNGERIYFTATSERSGRIDYSGGVEPGGMMMGGRLTCASCHGTDARGGTHVMHMEEMTAPDIRWSALAGHGDGHQDETEGEEPHEEEPAYDLDTFALAVIEGRHPDGGSLSREMPRWRISEADLADLAAYLQSLSDA